MKVESKMIDGKQTYSLEGFNFEFASLGLKSGKPSGVENQERVYSSVVKSSVKSCL